VLVERVELDFQLDAHATVVRSRLRMRHSGARGGLVRLDGVGLELSWLAIDGRRLCATDYALDDAGITIADTPEAFTLESEVRLHPAANSALVGLYQSGGHLCTQCEAEGFRRITWFPDRPDVLATYSVRVEADPVSYPYLLCNGNLVASGMAGTARHYAVWEDPFPKPCYLFAVVAGSFDVVERRIRRASGRLATLRIFVARGETARAAFALDALERAVRWDEVAFSRELDLDVFMVVAIRDFNFGAMENKGLNVFSSSCILADANTATDEDHERIERLIAHEYFHNWSGNRVTCRDWFQLSVKEGLTVFREQAFCIEQRGVTARIRQVRVLRARQFSEDAGSLAHAVRPAAFQNIDNFYTATVYEKGAELVRLLGTMLGDSALRSGIIEYFERCDGKAATVEDFLASFALPQPKFGGMLRWYSQAGTPELNVCADYEPARKELTVHFEQRTPPTPGESVKHCVPIPVHLALLDEEGGEQPFRVTKDDPLQAEATLLVSEAACTVKLCDVARPPVLSLMRGFSAPVRKRVNEPLAHAFVRLAADRDLFNRWDAMHELATRFILCRLAGSADAAGEDRLAESLAAVVRDDSLPPGLRAALLALPSESELSVSIQPLDPVKLHLAREGLERALSRQLRTLCRQLHETHSSTEPYSPHPADAGRRALRNAALQLLVTAGDDGAVARAQAHYADADNLTDRLAALQALARCDEDASQESLRHFYTQWQREPLAIDKWFAVQARHVPAGAIDRIIALSRHPAFDPRSPDRLRALVEPLALENPTAFHTPDGSGYAFVATQILAVDTFNPIVAARLIDCFADWQRYVSPLSSRMHAELRRLVTTRGASPNLVERASTALDSSPS